MRNLTSIKPQDILILLKLFIWGPDRIWQNLDIAKELGLSPYEISVGLERCRFSGFLDASKKNINKSALLEFILHGLKYIYPVHPGPICRGMPTAHSAPPLASKIMSNQQDQYVWPDEDGTIRGQSIEPIHKTALLASKNDQKLYKLLSLIDAIRVGRARGVNPFSS